MNSVGTSIFFQVLGEVRLRERADAVVRALVARLHALQPERVPDSLRHVRARPVRAEERAVRKVHVQLRTVFERQAPELVEDRDVQPARVVLRPDHHRRHSANEHRLPHAPRPVPPDVAGDLAPARREPDERRVAQIERLHQRRQIVGVGVHLVAVPGLRRTPVPAPVVRNAPEPALGQEEHLALPAVAVQRPAVREHHHGARAPVLVVNFRPVLHPDRRHRRPFVRTPRYRPPAPTNSGWASRSRPAVRRPSARRRTKGARPRWRPPACRGALRPWLR